MEDFRLKIFEAVSSEQSFTKAARRLGITQSAVSQCIAELEKTLSVQLFHRAKGPVILTEAGKMFSAYARNILNLYTEISENFVSGGQSAEHCFSADVTPDAASVLFPDLIAPFIIRGYKFLQVCGAADFSVSSILQEKDVRMEGCECVGFSPLCAVIHPSAPEAYAGVLSLSSIESLKFAVWTPSMSLVDNVRSKVVFSSHSTDSILNLVSQTDHIAGIVPAHSVYKKLADRTLVRLPVIKYPGNAAVYLKASDEFASTDIYRAIRSRLVSLLEFNLLP